MHGGYDRGGERQHTTHSHTRHTRAELRERERNRERERVLESVTLVKWLGRCFSLGLFHTSLLLLQLFHDEPLHVYEPIMRSMIW